MSYSFYGYFCNQGLSSSLPHIGTKCSTRLQDEGHGAVLELYVGQNEWRVVFFSRLWHIHTAKYEYVH